MQAFELRRDALAGIADDIPTALGDEGRDDAIDRIAEDMRAFLASDVLFARAQADIQTVLDERGRQRRRSTTASSCPSRSSAGSTLCS